MNQKKCAHLIVGLTLAMTALATPAGAGPSDNAPKALKNGDAPFVADAQPALPAAPVSPPPVAPSSPAGHGAAASGNTTTVSDVAAEASTLTSTGAFSPPEMNIIQRAAFGPEAGEADAYQPIQPPAIDRGVFFNIFAGSAALALLLTVGAAFALSRTSKADGSPGRALTLGTKLVGGFGAVVTGILVVSMLSSRASTSVANATAEAEHIGDQDILVLNMVNDMWATRTFVNHFLITNSQEDLVRYSDSTAAFANKLDTAKQAMKDPEGAKIIENIGGLMEEYEHKFAEVVKLIDERNAIVDGQMGPSAERATTLMREIALTAHTDGDDVAGFTAAETNEKFQEARLAFFRFLRQGDKQFAKDAIEHAEETMHELGLLGSQIESPARRAWLKEAGEAITFWISRMEHAEKLQEERNELVKNGLDHLGPQIADSSAEILGLLHHDRAEITNRAHATASAAKLQTAMVSGIVAVLGAILALAIARGIIKGLNRIVETLQTVAGRDLTRPPLAVTANDEIGKLAQATDAMSATLTRMISDIGSGALQIDAGGTQIASASQSLAQGASEQASSLQQISASLEQISGQTQQSAENARQANTLAEEAKKAADRGQQEMSQMSQAVNEIKQSSGEISKIIKVIDEIAFQTNLLALNAAVEAARAGEAGKGFAVVAEEVRNLAQRSAQAAKNTSGMIEESVKRSENGVQIAGRVGKALEDIAASTNKVNTLLSEIASAAGEQSTGVGQVNQGVGQLNMVTQQNAGNSEELASSAEELSSQVASLNELVAQFKVSNEGRAAAPRSTTTKSRPPAPAQPLKSNQTPLNAPWTHPSNAGGRAAGAPTPEQVIPMEDNEVLASF